MKNKEGSQMCDLKKAILMNKKDNVATALFPIKKNDRAVIVYNNEIITEIVALDDIEIYHKLAIQFIQNGELVYKYGEIIGKSTNCIRAGEHVHVNNIESVMGKNEN
jgi:altronate dehydratase small subunit